MDSSRRRSLTGRFFLPVMRAMGYPGRRMDANTRRQGKGRKGCPRRQLTKEDFRIEPVPVN